MKKIIFFAMSVLMAVCFAGTAMAIDYVHQFDPDQGFTAQPLIGRNGTTAYLLSGADPGGNLTAKTGATLW